MSRALSFALLVTLVTGFQPAFACAVPYIRTFDNQAVNGSMRVKTGKPCAIVLLHSMGPMDRAEILRRPSNGNVTIGAGNRIIYRSRAGFVGSDVFVYARRGATTQNAVVTRTVRVAVTVTP
jgi:hypothetical protein